MSEPYLKLRARLETAEALKVDLENTLTECHNSGKRVKYSKVEETLKIFETECQIPGIREVEMVIALVAKSNSKLVELQEMIDIGRESDDAGVISRMCKQAKGILSKIEVDMEEKEVQIRA